MYGRSILMLVSSIKAICLNSNGIISVNSATYKVKGVSSQFTLKPQNKILVSMLEPPTKISVCNINDLQVYRYDKTTYYYYTFLSVIPST